jgi:hypothetical protein
MTETNAITNQVINYLLYNGHFASRIQSQGQYSPTRGRWIKSKVRRGIGDIIACVNGKFWMIEIKTGKDRQSDFQKSVEQDVNKAGGVYLIVRTLGDFIGYYESNNTDSNTQQGGDNSKSDKGLAAKSGRNTNRVGSVRKRRTKVL